MTIPDFQAIMLPLLQYASDSKEHSLRDAITYLADVFNLQQIVIKPGTRTPPPTPSNIKSLSFSSPRSGGIEGGARRGQMKYLI
ncbi:MAG: hypothetical protein WBA52_01065 [Dolichospermum sp.]